jgi:hypothetical protein
MPSAGPEDFVYLRRVLTSSILLLAIGFPATAQWSTVLTKAQLSVTVYVRAGIGDSSLGSICMQAQGIASGILATAGVHVTWRTGQPKAHELGRPILIDITADSPETLYRGALGYAYVFEGVHIGVFYDRVRNASYPHATAILLAHVLVHEITHILEGVDRHSGQGVMKAHWTEDDLVQMLYKPLPFDPEDVVLMRAGLASRGYAARDAPLGPIWATRSSR